MTDLADFLLARIAEDEAAAEQAVIIRTKNGLAWTAPPPEHGALIISGHRLLAECEAKRRIVETHPIYPDGDQHDCPGEWPGYQDAPNEPCPTLRLLALPYADHSDYRAEWKV